MGVEARPAPSGVDGHAGAARSHRRRFRAIGLAPIVAAAVVLLGVAVDLPGAQAAGLRSLTVPADAQGPEIHALLWTPCGAPAQAITLGPFTVPGVRDCPAVDQPLALIVVSHGHGGTYLAHHDTAEALADAGFSVVALNHPGDTALDMSRAGDLSVLETRPTDVERLLDFLLGPDFHAVGIDPRRIGFFGFSRGGYTGLVLVGADPDFRHATAPCPDPQAPLCAQMQRSAAPPALTHDPRIKALVIADPLNLFPTSASLRKVTAPLQLWGSQYGGDGVLPQSVVALADDLPQRPEVHIVQGAAHFAFLTPCDARLTQRLPELCIDAAGFDRQRFHSQFNQAVVAFFRDHLAR
ncbi:putative dienelactone hydrolase [Roseiarcus fermentans]|uniref:Putative dienelactone hydrolase n=2 Tax=Roseiarcus fermentans TaxID=1473586 RepID=A0A366FSV2_9HYPH|nr:putative dienelactone hydrolase [Roseiarcus fermentans]